MQPITSQRIGVSLAPDQLQLAPGGRASVVLVVTNHSAIVDQFGLVVDGLDRDLFSVREGVVNLFPDASGHLEMEIHLPQGRHVAAGRHDVALSVIPNAAPDAAAVVYLSLEILEIGGIEAALRPQRVNMGWRSTGRFTLIVDNHSNTQQLVDLQLADPQGALELHVQPDRLAINAGESTEAAITARPKRRALAEAPRSYAFTASVVPVQSDDLDGARLAPPLAALTGELVYNAPLGFITALPPGLRRLLLGLAALALAAAVAIWLLGAPGRRGALIERVPLTKPVVAAAESAFNLPDPVAAVPSSEPESIVGGLRVKKFELAVPGQDGRTDYALVWQVEGAERVKIDGSDQSNPTSGSVHLDNLQNSEHTLEASKGGLTVNQSVGIVILRRPEVQEFVATPETIAPGQSSTLRWKVTRADRASLDDQTIDPAGGSLQVSPAETTSYTLVVENELGRIERTVQVKVAPGPQR